MVEDRPIERIYLDSCVLIISAESENSKNEFRKKLLELVQDPHVELITSTITISEVLIKPLRELAEGVNPEGNGKLVTFYKDIVFPALDISVIPVSPSIASSAAEVRSKHKSLKLPDAIHIATGTTEGCSKFFTDDKEWQKTGLTAFSA